MNQGASLLAERRRRQRAARRAWCEGAAEHLVNISDISASSAAKNLKKQESMILNSGAENAVSDTGISFMTNDCVKNKEKNAEFESIRAAGEGVMGNSDCSGDDEDLPCEVDVCGDVDSARFFADGKKERKKELKFHCRECDKRFYRPQHLRSHMQSHSGERPFACAQCGATFGMASNMRRHERLHADARPYVCDSCPSRFRRLDHLKNHVRRSAHRYSVQRQPGKGVQHARHACLQCGQRFEKVETLKQHRAEGGCEAGCGRAAGNVTDLRVIVLPADEPIEVECADEPSGDTKARLNSSSLLRDDSKDKTMRNKVCELVTCDEAVRAKSSRKGAACDEMAHDETYDGGETSSCKTEQDERVRYEVSHEELEGVEGISVELICDELMQNESSNDDENLIRAASKPHCTLPVVGSAAISHVRLGCDASANNEDFRTDFESDKLVIDFREPSEADVKIENCNADEYQMQNVGLPDLSKSSSLHHGHVSGDVQLRIESEVKLEIRDTAVVNISSSSVTGSPEIMRLKTGAVATRSKESGKCIWDAIPGNLQKKTEGPRPIVPQIAESGASLPCQTAVRMLMPGVFLLSANAPSLPLVSSVSGVVPAARVGVPLSRPQLGVVQLSQSVTSLVLSISNASPLSTLSSSSSLISQAPHISRQLGSGLHVSPSGASQNQTSAANVAPLLERSSSAAAAVSRRHNAEQLGIFLGAFKRLEHNERTVEASGSGEATLQELGGSSEQVVGGSGGVKLSDKFLARIAEVAAAYRPLKGKGTKVQNKRKQEITWTRTSLSSLVEEFPNCKRAVEYGRHQRTSCDVSVLSVESLKVRSKDSNCKNCQATSDDDWVPDSPDHDTYHTVHWKPTSVDDEKGDETSEDLRTNCKMSTASIVYRNTSIADKNPSLAYRIASIAEKKTNCETKQKNQEIRKPLLRTPLKSPQESKDDNSPLPAANNRNRNNSSLKSNPQKANHASPQASNGNVGGEDPQGAPCSTVAPGPNTCTVCNKSFKKPSHYLSHMVTHTKERAFNCRVCGKSFGQGHNLTRHMKRHSAVKQHACSVCPKRFHRLDHLRLHERTRSHTNYRDGTGQYRCSQCGEVLSHFGEFKMHCRAAHCRNVEECVDVGRSLGRSAKKCANVVRSPRDMKKSVAAEVVSPAMAAGNVSVGQQTSDDAGRQKVVELSISESSNSAPVIENREKLLTPLVSPRRPNFIVCSKVADKVEKSCTEINGLKHIILTRKKLFPKIFLSRNRSPRKGGRVLGVLMKIPAADLTDDITVKSEPMDIEKEISSSRLLSSSASLVPESVWTSNHTADASLANVINLDGTSKAGSIDAGRQVFHCSLCSQSFDSVHSLSIHMRSHARKNPYSCDQCSTVFDSQQNLLRHKRRHRERLKQQPQRVLHRWFVCAVCRWPFRSLVALRAHQTTVHAGEPAFDCAECGKKFDTIEMLGAHCDSDHMSAAGLGRICVVPVGITCGSDNNAKKSIGASGTAENHSDADCRDINDEISTAGNYAREMDIDSDDANTIKQEVAEPNLEESSHLTDVDAIKPINHLPGCLNQSVVDKPSRIDRANVETGTALSSPIQALHGTANQCESAFTCTHCKASYALPQLLYEHTRLHSGARPGEPGTLYVCPDCPLRFRLLTSLHSHQRSVHARTDMHRCAECGRVFRWANNYEAHCAVVHGVGRGRQGKGAGGGTGEGAGVGGGGGMENGDWRRESQEDGKGEEQASNQTTIVTPNVPRVIKLRPMPRIYRMGKCGDTSSVESAAKLNVPPRLVSCTTRLSDMPIVSSGISPSISSGEANNRSAVSKRTFTILDSKIGSLCARGVSTDLVSASNASHLTLGSSPMCLVSDSTIKPLHVSVCRLAAGVCNLSTGTAARVIPQCALLSQDEGCDSLLASESDCTSITTQHTRMTSRCTAEVATVDFNRLESVDRIEEYVDMEGIKIESSEIVVDIDALRQDATVQYYEDELDDNGIGSTCGTSAAGCTDSNPVAPDIAVKLELCPSSPSELLAHASPLIAESDKLCVDETKSRAPVPDCTVCRHSFVLPSHARLHSLRHAGERAHRCAQCGAVCSSSLHLARHARVHAEVRPYGCARCLRRFERLGYLRMHQRRRFCCVGYWYRAIEGTEGLNGSV